jgi:cyclic-di-GMP phosphodiesterase TipF (flagellum assembly factor)
VLAAGTAGALAVGLGLGFSTAIGWGASLPTAVATGTSFSLAGLAITLGVVHARQSAWLRRRLTRLERLIDDTEAMVGGLRGSIDGLHERVEGPATSGDLRAELKVLQELLAQVVTRRASASPAAAPSPQTPHQRVEPDVDVPLAQSNAHALNIMRAALDDNRVDLYLQPIVRLPSRKVSHYEAFSRVRDEGGDVVFPTDYLRPAEGAGLIATLDNLLLFRCTNLVRQLGPRRPGTKIFLNLSAGSLGDTGFLREFVGFMRQNRALAERLVFEVAAADLPALAGPIQEQLEALAALGFGFSIDRASHLNLDPAALAALNVQYVKIEAAALMMDQGPVRRDDLKAWLARQTIELIATHIETERQVVEILELGIDYGQGYLFGEPRPARTDLAAARAA